MDIYKFILYFALISFVVTTGFVSVGVSRIAWFDEAFSLETVRLMDEQKIDFNNYDVHPPLSYEVLSMWMGAEYEWTGISETEWARLLGILFGVLFIICVYYIVLELGYSKFVAASSALLMSISTTIIHYFTEIRMYGMLLCVASIAIMYLVKFLCHYTKCSVRYTLKGILLGRVSFAMMALACCIAPFIHYFGIFLGVYCLAVIVVVFRKEEWERYGTLVVSYLLVFGASLYFALDMAFSQRERIVQMFFEPTNMLALPSAWLFPFHYPEWTQMGAYWQNVVISFVQILVFVVVLAWFGRIIYDLFFVNEKYSRQKTIVTMFFLVSCFAALVIGLSSYVLDLYHHRFTLVLMWLFALAIYIVLMDAVEDAFKNASYVKMVALICVLVFVFFQAAVGQSVYMQETPRVQENIFSIIPCGENVTLIHETPFTYVPEIVNSRERGCVRERILITNFPVEVGNSAGFDVIRAGNVIRLLNENDTFAVERDSYIIDGGFLEIEGEKESLGHFVEHQDAEWDLYELKKGIILKYVVVENE